MDDRRRSKRLPIHIPVKVYGRTTENQPFREATEMKVISAHGGMLPLSPEVECGQTVLLVNSVTNEERICRIVNVEPENGSPKKIAVNFLEMDGDFWHVYQIGEEEPRKK
ncbi:MAG TPA: PilZ domain-containing protein [Verrucomicrobiae bacterium]|nr:PilZ domain-containing protein [Verrucomicrobiae bacterium]